MRIDKIKNDDIRQLAMSAAHQVLAKSQDMTEFQDNLGIFLDVSMSDPEEPKVLGGMDVGKDIAVLTHQIWTDGEGNITKSRECIHYPTDTSLDALSLNAARNDINNLVMDALNEEKVGKPHRPYYEFFSQFQC